MDSSQLLQLAKIDGWACKEGHWYLNDICMDPKTPPFYNTDGEMVRVLKRWMAKAPKGVYRAFSISSVPIIGDLIILTENDNKFHKADHELYIAAQGALIKWDST